MSTEIKAAVAKKSLWGIIVFYLLIAFEIFYMAGPFAVYFYGIYNPILNIFNQSPVLITLNSFFLPHVAVETSSAFINARNHIGGILALGGFIVFLIGACQIYYSKFKRKGAVLNGIYKYIRHPQYVFFAVCGFGLLILWPRYINLLMYITMLFVYYALAKAEEKECEEKFGKSYIEYKNRTNMFFPIKHTLIKNVSLLPKSGGKRVMVILALYVFALIIGFGIAKSVHTHSINSLYTVYSDNFVTVSISRVDNDRIEQIMSIASSNEEVKNMVNMEDGNTLFLNYILPVEWFAAEIPMNGIVYRQGHRSPSSHNNFLYKIIFTSVETRGNENVTGKEILANVMTRSPLLEVWVDLRENMVTQILEIPEEYKYKGIPVAVY